MLILQLWEGDNAAESMERKRGPSGGRDRFPDVKEFAQGYQGKDAKHTRPHPNPLHGKHWDCVSRDVPRLGPLHWIYPSPGFSNEEGAPGCT